MLRVGMPQIRRHAAATCSPPPLWAPLTPQWRGPHPPALQTSDMLGSNFAANLIVLVFSFMMLILVNLYTANTGGLWFSRLPPYQACLLPCPMCFGPSRACLSQFSLAAASPPTRPACPAAAANLTADRLQNSIRSVADLPWRVVGTWEVGAALGALPLDRRFAAGCQLIRRRHARPAPPLPPHCHVIWFCCVHLPALPHRKSAMCCWRLLMPPAAGHVMFLSSPTCSLPHVIGWPPAVQDPVYLSDMERRGMEVRGYPWNDAVDEEAMYEALRVSWGGCA
jgi:hypothetical protein